MIIESLQAVPFCDRHLDSKICSIMTTITNAKKLRQYKSSLSLIVVKMLAFALSNSLLRDVLNTFPNFKQISWRFIKLRKIIIRSNFDLLF